MKVARFGAVFDLDGVVARTGRLHDAAWLQVVNKGRAVKWEVADLHRLAGNSTKLLAQRLCPEATSEAAVMAIVAEKDRVYETLLRRQLLTDPNDLKVPGACELIGQLAEESVSLALNTSSPSSEAELILSAFGVQHQFSLILTGEVVANPKPHREGYLLAAQGLGLPPERCAGFEDSLPGLTSLNAAGYGMIVAVGSILSEAQVKASGLRIDRYIPDFSALTLKEILAFGQA